MATLTSTAFASDAVAVHAGVNQRTVIFNSSATAISNSATTILLCKLPHGARILELVEHHTCGAASCPADFGITGDTAAFISAGTLGVVNRLSAVGGVGYQVSVSANAIPYGTNLVATVTPGTTTASVIVRCTIFYAVDEKAPD